MTNMTLAPADPSVLRKNFAALTGLRAVASLAVVATHAAFWTGRYSSDTIGLMWARLDFGVALFFALSGFLLFRPWLVALIRRDDQPSVPTYLWNRALRILPAFWVVVVAAVLFLDSRNGSGPFGLLRQLTLTHIYGTDHIRSGLTQTWSLATEIAFYAVLPVFGWFVVRVLCRGQWRPGRITIFLGALCAANFAYFALIYNVETISITSRMWLPAYLSWFAVGMVLAVMVVAAHEGRQWAARPMALAADSPLAACLVALGLLALASTPIAGVPSLFQESVSTAITRNVLYAGAAFLLMAPLVTNRSNVVQKALATAPMQWLGKISYELFLVHVLLLELAMNLLGYETFTGSILLAFTLTLILSIPASWLLYRSLEVPLQRFHR